MIYTNTFYFFIYFIEKAHVSTFKRGKEEESMDRDLQDILSNQKSIYIHPSFRNYTYAFKPDQMICSYKTVSSVKKMMLLFGTSQIEA